MITLGQSNNPTIICLHGGPGMDHSYFLPFLEPLSKNNRLVLYTQGENLAEMTMKGLIEELHKIVNSLNTKSIYLLGHSFGGSLALEYIKTHGQSHLTGLILSNWVYNGQWLQEFIDNHPGVIEKTTQEVESQSTDPNERFKLDTLAYTQFYFAPSNQKIGHEILSRIKYNHAISQNLWQSYLTNFDVTEIVKTLSLPTISIAGLEDGIVSSAYIKSGAALNPKITHHEISGAGHFPFVENPKQFQQLIQNLWT